MRVFMVAAFCVVSSAALAQDSDWVKMNGAEIKEALTDRVLDYGDKWQDFRASGRTLYVSGQESWGYWAVREQQYCSMWPPSDLWACYDMVRKGDKLRFVGSRGDISEAWYKVESE